MARYVALALALTLLGLLAPLRAQNAPQSRISLLGLRVLTPEDALRIMQRPYAEGGVKEFIPDGVTITPMPDVKALLLRSADEQALSQMEKIVSALDAKRQQRHADVSLFFVELAQVDALALRGSMHDNVAEQELRAQVAGRELPPVTPWLTGEELKEKLDRLRQTGRATVHALEAVTFFDGEATAIDLRSLNAPYAALLFGDVHIAEETLTLSALPILAGVSPKEGSPLAAYRGVGPMTFSARRGSAMEVIIETAPANPDRRLMLFALPTGIGLSLARDLDGLLELPPLF
jgi:hypothetical protein